MRLLFVDDDLENVSLVASVLRDALGAECILVTTVEEAVAALHASPVHIVIADLFIPMGPGARETLGPRARKYAEQVEDLGGLVLLDEIDRVEPPPIVLLHTACRDHVLLELLGERVAARVRKPAPTEVLLNAVLEAMRELPGRS